MFGLVSSKKLSEVKTELNKIREELEETQTEKKRRKIQESYLFTGDLNKNIYGQDSEDRSDLTVLNYQEVQKQCYDAFKTFPYAKRVIELVTDFVIGAKLTYTIADEHKKKLEIVMEDFWTDFDNDFDLYLEGMLNELYVLGEQIYPPAVVETTNIVKLGIVDPREVDRIMRDKTNSKRLSQVILTLDAAGDERVYGVIQEVGGKLAVPEYARNVGAGKKYEGDVFLFQINRLPTQTRGYSELTTMIEHLDLLDQFLFQATEKALLMYQFIADVLIKNKTEKEIDEFNVPDPRKNVIFKHNQNVEMKLHTPDIKAVEIDKFVGLLSRYILVAVGIPEHWVVQGGNANLATAKEQNNPIEKRLERKQGITDKMLKTLVRYQFEKKFPNSTSSEIKKYVNAVKFSYPSVAGVDRKLRAQVMLETAKALVIAVAQNWVAGSDAAEEFVKLSNKYGMDLTALKVDDELKSLLKVPGKDEIDNAGQLDDYFLAVDKMAKDIEFGSGKKIGQKVDAKTV